ncbi:MAG: M24 family metallopeptidase [Pseudomonadota bacterium]
MTRSRPFTDAEYTHRIQRTKHRMENAGFELLVVCDPANMNWLTGYDGWSFYQPQAVLVHQAAERPIWFGRAQDARAASLTTGLSDDDVIAYAEDKVHHSIHHPFDELAELIGRRGWHKASMAVEMDAPYYTARCHHHLMKHHSFAQIFDSGNLVNWARQIKSEAEIALMREAGAIVTQAIATATQELRPGRRQHEVIAEIYRSLTLGADGKGGDYAAICPLMPVGLGTSTPHLTWTEAPLPETGLVMLEIAGVRHRYHAPLTRSFHLGQPPTDIADTAKVCIEAGDAAMAKAAPGMTCEAVEAIWQGVLKKYGLKKKSRVGYPIGVGYPPDWGERTCSLRPGDKTELRPGMCFHFQAGLWLDQFGVAISEGFVVTETGIERFANAPRELIVIG